MQKKMKLKKGNFALLICFIVVIIIIFYLTKSNAFIKYKIKGSWTTDNITVYKFNKNNTGKMIVSLSEYEFHYKIKKNELYIDFNNDKVEDTKYTYSFKNNKLELKNEKGTFTFTKK